MLKIEYFKYVVEIAKHKSISKAADELYLSQPYLSSELKKLEQAMGFALFVRSRKGMSLTVKGEQFLAIAEDICKLEAKASDLGQDTVSDMKKLSVSSIYSFTTLEIFRQFTSSMPDEQMDFAYEEMPNTNIPDRIQSGASDLGLVYLHSTNEQEKLASFASQDLIFTPLLCEPLYFVVGRLHPLANRKSVVLDELLPYPRMVEKIKSWDNSPILQDNTLFPELFTENVQMPMRFDNSRSLMFYLSRSESCFWVGQRSLNLESPFFLQGELVFIPILDANVTLTTGYILSNKRTKDALLSSFINVLENYFLNID